MNTKKMDGDSGTNFIINYLKAMLRNTCFNYEYVQFFKFQLRSYSVVCTQTSRPPGAVSEFLSQCPRVNVRAFSSRLTKPCHLKQLGEHNFRISICLNIRTVGCGHS